MQSNTGAAVMGKTKPTPLNKFKRGLEAAIANMSHKVESIFAEAYKDVEYAIVLDVPQKTIIEQLNGAYGLKLHPKRFRELLQCERDRRSKTGEVITCKTCGHSLNAKTSLNLVDTSGENSHGDEKGATE